MQLSLFSCYEEVDITKVYSVWNEKAFDWHECFHCFCNFSYWKPNLSPEGWVLEDYRNEFHRLTGVFISMYVLDGYPQSEVT